MKRFLLFIALLILGLGLNAQNVGDVTTVNYGSYYITSESECTLFEYGGSPAHVTIPSTITFSGKEFAVTSIGEEAFRDCSSLTSIEIPSGVTSIGNYAFRECSSLIKVFCLAEDVPSIRDNSFLGGCPNYMTIYVPIESVDAYKLSWNRFVIKSIICEVATVINPKEAGVVTGAGFYSVRETENVTLSATPNEYYKFVNWTENGEAVSTDAEYTFTITGERNLVANFSLLDYDVIVSVNPESAGSVTGAGNYNHGDNVTLTATTNEGYKFVNWTENGNIVSANTKYTFKITSNRNLVANFELLDDPEQPEDPGDGPETPGESISEYTALFTIHPNPVNNKLHIETEFEIEEVVVYDVYGRQQTTDNGQQLSCIDVSNLNSGVYFIMIKTNDGVVTKRFVKE